MRSGGLAVWQSGGLAVRLWRMASTGPSLLLRAECSWVRRRFSSFSISNVLLLSLSPFDDILCQKIVMDNPRHPNLDMDPMYPSKRQKTTLSTVTTSINVLDVDRDQRYYRNSASEVDKVLKHIMETSTTRQDFMKETLEAQLEHPAACLKAVSRIRMEHMQLVKRAQSLDYAHGLVQNEVAKLHADLQRAHRTPFKAANPVRACTPPSLEIQGLISGGKSAEPSPAEDTRLENLQIRHQKDHDELVALNINLVNEKARLEQINAVHVERNTQLSSEKADLAAENVQLREALSQYIQPHRHISGANTISHPWTLLGGLDQSRAQYPKVPTSYPSGLSRQHVLPSPQSSFSRSWEHDQSTSPLAPPTRDVSSNSAPRSYNGPEGAIPRAVVATASSSRAASDRSNHQAVNIPAHQSLHSNNARAGKAAQSRTSYAIGDDEASVPEPVSFQAVLSHFDIQDPISGQRTPATSMDSRLLTSLTPLFESLQTRQALDAFIVQPRSGVRCAQERRQKAISKSSLTKLQEGQSDACLHCIEKGLLCVLVAKGGRPLIVPLPAECRRGAQPHEAAFWLNPEPIR